MKFIDFSMDKIEFSLLQDAIIEVLMKKQKNNETNTIEYKQYESLNTRFNILKERYL